MTFDPFDDGTGRGTKWERNVRRKGRKLQTPIPDGGARAAIPDQPPFISLRRSQPERLSISMTISTISTM